MPATSVKQRRYFGAIAGGAIPQPEGMSDKTVHDFAATKEKGLPMKAMADGGKADPIITKRRYFNGQGPNVMGGPPQSKYMADGGHWMESAFKNAGKPGHSLHATLGVPKDKKIPGGKLAAATHASSPHTRKMAQLAENVQ